MKYNHNTNIYAVIGNPVKQSKSPQLFNAIFKHYNLNSIYLSFAHKSTEKLVEAIRTFSFKGASVTIPHKENIMNKLDNIDELAKEIGCVNTILNKDNELFGYNFDGIGAIEALEVVEKDWKMCKKILFLGGGGAARGISLSMLLHSKFDQNIDFLVRNKEKVSVLSNRIKELGGKSNVISKEEIEKEEVLKYDIIINTTPIGMNNELESPLSYKQIPRKAIIYDIIYNSKNTLFLKYGREKNNRVIDGLGMFLNQASYQLKEWTGIKLNYEEMKFFLDL